MAKDFSRDLGYLDKFLQGLRAHAATLGEPAASRLASMLGEQERAWGEIRSLLAGAKATASGATGPGSEASNASSPGSATATASQTSASPRRFTVGSMID